jgi:DNA-binding transcriptional regulator YiaG
MSLAEIERLVGEPLPDSARRKPAFWSNRRGGLQSAAWLAAGYRVTDFDRSRRKVRFERPKARQAPPKAGAVRWDGDAVRALREHLDLNQEAMAEVLGVRQQTISEWETGAYAPSRSRSKHLDLVAERAGFGDEPNTNRTRRSS